jgi:hypothetical protein
MNTRERVEVSRSLVVTVEVIVETAVMTAGESTTGSELLGSTDGALSSLGGVEADVTSLTGDLLGVTGALNFLAFGMNREVNCECAFESEAGPTGSSKIGG